MKRQDFNSSKNQEIKGQLVQREVICHVGQMINEIQNSEAESLKQEIFELFYSLPNYWQAMENYFYDIPEEEIKEHCENYDVEKWQDIEPEEFCDDMSLDFDYLEPYEFWAVTPYFGNRLKDHGEIVADFLGFTIWARCATGQAILLDHVISMIANDMEILEGQKHQW